MEEKSNNALIGSIIIVIVIIIGGIYFWQTAIKNKIQNPVSNTQVTQPTGTTPEATGTDVSDIEKDLNSLDVNNLDQGL